jgi:hypothetical protein
MAGILNQLESVSKFAPDRFRAQFMVGLGYATNNRFKVELPSIDNTHKPDDGKVKDPLGKVLGSVNGETRNMLCTAANMPGKELQTIERNYGSEKRQIASGHTLPPVNLTFYLTNTYSMRKYWGNWMHACSSQEPDGPMLVGYQQNYQKQVTVSQYTKNARRVMRIKLIDAFPISMSSVELNNQPQTAVSELTVSLAYRTYEEDYRWN